MINAKLLLSSRKDSRKKFSIYEHFWTIHTGYDKQPHYGRHRTWLRDGTKNIESHSCNIALYITWKNGEYQQTTMCLIHLYMHVFKCIKYMHIYELDVEKGV